MHGLHNKRTSSSLCHYSLVVENHTGNTRWVNLAELLAQSTAESDSDTNDNNGYQSSTSQTNPSPPSVPDPVKGRTPTQTPCPHTTAFQPPPIYQAPPLWGRSLIHHPGMSSSPGTSWNRRISSAWRNLDINVTVLVDLWPFVTILFPHHSIFLIVHSFRLLTWRGRGNAHFLNTAYLLVHSLSSFSVLSLSLDTFIS